MVLIAKNEAKNLARCLSSVSFADEIIVIESGSTDDTVGVARQFGATVVSTLDWPGFGLQKNRGLALARGVWVLCLDVDEVISDDLKLEIRAKVEMDSQIDDDAGLQAKVSRKYVGYEIPRMTQFRGQWIRHCGWTPDRVLRLIRREAGRFTNDLVHERIVLFSDADRVGRISSPILHFSYADPDQYWAKLQRYSNDWARQRHAIGQTATITRAVLAAWAAFIRTYFFRLGFLDGSLGFAVCFMQAQAAYSKYFELFCLGRQERG